jgi:predicted DsbA family dithiol-disulfide isomerase
VISATLYSDPGCPWAYSEIPALRVLQWRYRDQLAWRLVVVGLTEDTAQYQERGFTPVRNAVGQLMFRQRYGMPFSPLPKARLSATSRACRLIVAARLTQPGSEWGVLRALQFANFNTALILDDDRMLVEVLEAARLEGGLVSRIEDPDVIEAYERDRAETRTAEGSAAALQRKTRVTDGPMRFTAPTVAFERDGLRMIAGGFQPVEAYDVLVANLDPTLHREPPPENPESLLEHFHEGLTTMEVAALMAAGNEPPDRTRAEAALLELVAADKAVRELLGDDAVWRAA